MAPDHKNIVMLIADDLGLMLGCYGLQAIRTPNIDKLASQGTKFTHAFASTASCSGSRSTIYTGLHTHQNGQYGLSHGWNHFQTHDHIQTLPHIFNALGYQTGIIGKVHVGPRRAYPWEWYAPSETRDVRDISKQTGDFMAAAAESRRPFHLTVGFRDPHRDATRGGFGNDDAEVRNMATKRYGPEDVEIPEYLSDVPELRLELAEYYQSISRMDDGVGLIMAELEKHQLTDNTLVMFLSDNGAPFVNSKTTLFDAGVRLPLIVRDPTCPNIGVVNPNMVSFLDILPTCIDWAGHGGDDIKADKEETEKSPPRLGTSFLPVLGTPHVLQDSEWDQVVFGSHTFHEIQNYWPTRFMRTRRYKYHRNIAWRLDFPFGTDLYGSLSWEGIRNSAATSPERSSESHSDTPEVMLGRRPLTNYLFRGPEELFDLENDPEELHNLAHDDDPEHRKLLVQMRERTEKWQYLTDDVWLMKDGVSAIVSEGYQRQGLRLVDRFDFEASKPVNRHLDNHCYWAPAEQKMASEETTKMG